MDISALTLAFSESSSCGSGCEAEKVLPEHPKQWNALPPSRCDSRSIAMKENFDTEVAKAGVPAVEHFPFVTQPSFPNSKVQPTIQMNSNLFAGLTHIFQQLEDLNEHFSSVLKLRAHIFEDYEMDIKNQSSPKTSLFSCDAHAVDSHHQGANTDIEGKASNRNTSSGGEMAQCIGNSRHNLESVQYNTHVPQQSRDTDSSIVCEIIETQPSRVSYDFQMRDEWKLDDEQLFRIAAKGTVEMGVSRKSSMQFGYFKIRSSLMPGHSMNHVPWHPENTSRFYWDLLGTMLLAGDTIMLPLFFFEFNPSIVTGAFDCVTASFWTLDIFATLCTGAFVKGQLEMRFPKVFKKYAKTWLTLDIFMVLTEWLLLIIGDNGASAVSSVSVVRNIRILRFLRLLRLVKFEKFSIQFLRRVNSAYLILAFRIMKTILAIIVANHILAGIWFAIGINGWVILHIPDTTDVLYCYLTSFYWTLTQFHGSDNITPITLQEKVFAVCLLLSAFVSVTWFVSSVTDSMITMQNIHQERSAQQIRLLAFFNQHRISKLLTVRIKEYIAMYQKQKMDFVRECDVSFLDVLPKNLMIDLHVEVRGASLLEHPLFDHLEFSFTPCYQQIVHEAMHEIYINIDDLIFSSGQACTRMLFANSEMSYQPGQLRKATALGCDASLAPNAMRACSNSSVSIPLGGDIKLSGKGWVSEPALWTFWVNCGNLTSLENGCIHNLEIDLFIKTVQIYECVCLDLVMYARIFVKHLNIAQLSDLPSGVDAREIWAELEDENQHQRVSMSKSSSIGEPHQRYSRRKSEWK